jgi:hypothetical protein
MNAARQRVPNIWYGYLVPQQEHPHDGACFRRACPMTTGGNYPIPPAKRPTSRLCCTGAGCEHEPWHLFDPKHVL